MTESVPTETVSSPTTLIEKFLDATPGEVYWYGRLYTRKTDRGTVQLIAYGNEILAEISAGADEVVLFTGHYGTVSETVTGYVEELGRVLSNTPGREVDVENFASPTRGIGARASDSAQYIDNYVGGFIGKFSPVEREAVQEVNQAVYKRVREDLA